MFRTRSQMLQIVARRSRVAVCALSAIALGIFALHGATEQGSNSFVCAAETPPDKGSAAVAKDDPSGQPRDTRTGEPTTFEAPAIEYFPRPTKYELKIIDTLDKPTSLEFLDLPFEDSIAFLKEYHKLNIWVDRQTLIDEGVALDQPITLKLAGVSLRSILKLLLEPVQLTYLIENDVMKITTAAHASDRVVTRIYPVRDLYRGQVVVNERQFDEKGALRQTTSEFRPGDLETAIVKTIEPYSWGNGAKRPHWDGFAAGETGSITYVIEAGSLVIRQTGAIHEQILQLLRDLREAKRVGLGGGRERPVPRTAWKLRGPKRAETYSIVGIIDLDGDDQSDSARLHEMIKNVGGSIDNEVDEQGVLHVDGAIPDDGRPRLTEKTKFVVVGKIPDIAERLSQDEIATALKIGGFYKDIEDQARAQGVRIIELKDFLRYIGYERVEGLAE